MSHPHRRIGQVGLRSLSDGTSDTTTASDELVSHILSALAQFERRLMQERTRARLAVARARGKPWRAHATVLGGTPRAERTELLRCTGKVYGEKAMVLLSLVG
jgi:DNA invertase Pin-like site-specific DNA recombinase